MHVPQTEEQGSKRWVGVTLSRPTGDEMVSSPLSLAPAQARDPPRLQLPRDLCL